MKVSLLSFVFVCVMSGHASAACTAPIGRYGGASAGLSIKTEVSPMTIKNVENVRWSANYAANGSGTLKLDIFASYNGTNYDQTINRTFNARGTTTHTWNATTCQGKFTIYQNSTPMGSYWYTVVQSGNEIYFNLPGSAPYTVTLKKL